MTYSAKIHYIKMAGKFGAIICKTSSFPGLYTLYKGTHSFFPRPHKSVFCSHNFSPFRSSSSSRNFKMATQQDPQSNSPEIKEPSPKIAKLDQTSGAGEGTKKDVDIDTLLRFKKLSENAFTPVRGSPFSAGYDLSSATDIKVPARGKALVPTDLSIGIPKGTYARIAPRSGLAWKHSIDVGAGVIDYDYRGPVGVILFNHSDRDFEIKLGDRIAQVIIEKIVNAQVVEVEELDLTYRGGGGFGSTGIC